MRFRERWRSTGGLISKLKPNLGSRLVVAKARRNRSLEMRRARLCDRGARVSRREIVRYRERAKMLLQVYWTLEDEADQKNESRLQGALRVRVAAVT